MTADVPKGTDAVNNHTLYVEGKGFLIECDHCKTKVYKKRENARFCSKKCKSAYHKNRTQKASEDIAVANL